MDAGSLMVFSPIIAGAICAMFFLVEVKRAKLNRRAACDNLFGFLFFGIVLGFCGAIALLAWLIIQEPSPQGPLAVILFAPMGIATGIVAATIAWRVYAK
jgi:hypothetical protein